MQIFEQQNAVKMHFSIIPYGITMSKGALPMGTTKRVPKARKTIYGKIK